MKILTIANCQPNPSHGSGQIIRFYTDGLRKSGHTVDFMGPDDYEVLRWFRPHATRYRQSLGMWSRSIKCVRANHYDVVEFYGGEAWLAISQLRRIPGRRFLIVQHTNGPEPRYEPLGRIPRRWYQLDQSKWMTHAFNQADAVVTVSQYDLDWIRGTGWLPAHRTLAIENPLPDLFLGQPFHAPRPPVIGFCGTWLPKKGNDLILDAIPLFLRQAPEYRLELVGVERNVVETFPQDVRGRIHCIPFIGDKEALKKWYRGLSIFILPSRLESFGLVTTEAMASGCAVITTRTGFGASLDHCVNAWVMEDATAPSLLAGLKALASTPSLREKIARNGHARVQSLRWEDASRRLATAYEGWMNELRNLRSAS